MTDDHSADWHTLADLLRVREHTKPYDFDPDLRAGDPVGWIDAAGVVHIETFKRLGSNGIEVEAADHNIAGALRVLTEVRKTWFPRRDP